MRRFFQVDSCRTFKPCCWVKFWAIAFFSLAQSSSITRILRSGVLIGIRRNDWPDTDGQPLRSRLMSWPQLVRRDFTPTSVIPLHWVSDRCFSCVHLPAMVSKHVSADMSSLKWNKTKQHFRKLFHYFFFFFVNFLFNV